MNSLPRLYRRQTVPGYYDTTRIDVLRAIEGPVNAVLDVGCGAGATLAHLKREGLAKRVVGVDINEAQLEEATRRGVDQVVHCDIEHETLELERRSFDLILCLDVLEHLVDPWETLRMLTSLLRPRGKVIASIPNVQNLRVLAPLIVGRWDYRAAGILDRTHLRFFTKRSVIELFNSAGLSVELLLHNIDSHPLPRTVNALTLGVFRRFVTVQYLVRGGC